MALSRKFLSTVTFMVFVLAMNNASAETFLDTKALLKEAVPGNPGLEMIIPFIVEIDNNDDFYPDKMNFRLRVYPAGSTTRIHQSPQRTFVPPDAPVCANAVFDDWDWELNFFGENNSHTGVAVNFVAECQAGNGNYKEALGAYVYVADTTQPGSAWGKTWARDFVSVDIIDWDDDQQDEVKVILASEVGRTERIRVIFLDKLTGAVESDKNYTAVQTFD